MEYTEVIKVLRNMLPTYRLGESTEALEVALDCVNKQIPQQIKVPLDAYWVCPVCGHKVNLSQEFCGHCGQALTIKKAFQIGDRVKDVETGETAYVLNPSYDEDSIVLSMKDYTCPQIQRKDRWEYTGYTNEMISKLINHKLESCNDEPGVV